MFVQASKYLSWDTNLHKLQEFHLYIYLCVEVLRPSQPIRVMLSVVVYLMTGLILYEVNQYLCTFFCQKLTTAILELAEESTCRLYQ